MPSAARIKVVFPAPFGPISPTKSPGSRARETASTTGQSPRKTESLSKVIRLMLIQLAFYKLNVKIVALLE